MLCLSIGELKVVLRYVFKSAVRHLNYRELRISKVFNVARGSQQLSTLSDIMAFYGIVGRIKWSNRRSGSSAVTTEGGTSDG